MANHDMTKSEQAVVIFRLRNDLQKAWNENRELRRQVGQLMSERHMRRLPPSHHNTKGLQPLLLAEG